LQVGVLNGHFALDDTGDPASTGYATLLVSVDPPTGTPSNGRYTFDQPLLDNLQVQFTGGFDLTLPINLSVLGFEVPAFGDLYVRSVGPNGLEDLFAGLASGDFSAVQQAISFQFPDIAGKFAQLGGEFSIIGLLNNPGIVLDGLDGILGNIQDTLD